MTGTILIGIFNLDLNAILKAINEIKYKFSPGVNGLKGAKLMDSCPHEQLTNKAIPNRANL